MFVRSGVSVLMVFILRRFRFNRIGGWMRNLIKLNLLFFLCTASLRTSGDEPCLDALSGLPRGSYIGKNCDDIHCFEAEYHYDAATDQLSLSRIILSGTNEIDPFKTIYNEENFKGEKTLPDACAWGNAGFDIDIR